MPQWLRLRHNDVTVVLGYMRNYPHLLTKLNNQGCSHKAITLSNSVQGENRCNNWKLHMCRLCLSSVFPVLMAAPPPKKVCLLFDTKWIEEFKWIGRSHKGNLN